jgi:hypothetical protein
VKKLGLTIVVVALAAASCSSSDDAEGTTTTTGATSESTTSSTTNDSVGDTTTSSASSTTSGTGSSGSIAECAVGVWELDSQAFFDAVFGSIGSDEFAGELMYIEGAYRLTLGTDGSIVSEQDGWTFGVAGDDGDFQMRISSVQTGTYTVDGDTVTASMAPGEDAPEVEIFVDGEPFTFPGGAIPMDPPEADLAAATITCSGNTLTANADDFTSTWMRTG